MAQARQKRTVAVALSILALAAGCGQSAAPAAYTTSQSAAPAKAPAAAQPAPKPLTPVTFQLDYLPAGYDAPFVIAKDKGYYKAAGLNVKIVPGKGSVITGQQVTSGTATFGFADFGTGAKLISKGAPIEAVMIVGQKTPLVIATRVSENVHRPAQLRGLSFGIIVGGLDSYMLPAFLDATHVPISSVKIVSVQPTQKDISFIDGKVDAQVAFTTFELPEYAVKHIKVDTMGFADHGVNLLYDGIWARTAYVRAHPKVVRGFVAATSKGWAYAATHIAQAVTDVKKQFPSIVPAIARLQLLAYLKLLHTKATQGKPFGWAAPSDVAASLNLLRKYDKLKTGKSPSAFYTNAYIPKG